MVLPLQRRRRSRMGAFTRSTTCGCALTKKLPARSLVNPLMRSFVRHVTLGDEIPRQPSGESSRHRPPMVERPLQQLVDLARLSSQQPSPGGYPQRLHEAGWKPRRQLLAAVQLPAQRHVLGQRQQPFHHVHVSWLSMLPEISEDSATVRALSCRPFMCCETM